MNVHGCSQLSSACDRSQLAPYKATAQPLLDALEEHAWLPFALLAAPALALLAALARLFGGGRVRSRLQGLHH